MLKSAIFDHRTRFTYLLSTKIRAKNNLKPKTKSIFRSGTETLLGQYKVHGKSNIQNRSTSPWSLCKCAHRLVFFSSFYSSTIYSFRPDFKVPINIGYHKMEIMFTFTTFEAKRAKEKKYISKQVRYFYEIPK